MRLGANISRSGSLRFPIHNDIKFCKYLLYYGTFMTNFCSDSNISLSLLWSEKTLHCLLKIYKSDVIKKKLT